MKKKGFTLVELLAVIAIIALIAALAISNIIEISNDYRQKGSEYQEEIIKNAAKQYVKSSESLKQQAESGLQISYQTLVNKGYLTENSIRDLKTNEVIDDLSGMYVCANYNRTTKKYTFTIGTCN